MKILYGKLVSNFILSNIKDKIENHINNSRRVLPKPSMCIVLVGDNPASESYVKSKTKACQRAGIEYNVLKFEDTITAFDLVEEIKKLNKSSYDGFIVQLPLPEHIKTDSIINEISAYKDIDGFHPINFGKMAMGQKSMRPATAYGILKLLEYYKIETCGKHIVVIGRSNLVGKPVSIMLGNDFNVGRGTISTCDINTPQQLLTDLTTKADIIIVAVGKPNLLTKDMVKEGAVVIDVGINRLDNKIVGDCDFDNVSEKCEWITPVPGGVGPMTIAGLISNLYEAWKMKNFIED